jgi:hypothetical protein
MSDHCSSSLVWVYICIYRWIYIYICFYMCIYVTVYMYVLCINVYMSTGVKMHTWHMYKGVRVYTYPMHSRLRTHTHTHNTPTPTHTHTRRTDRGCTSEGAPLPKKITFFKSLLHTEAAPLAKSGAKLMHFCASCKALWNLHFFHFEK